MCTVDEIAHQGPCREGRGHGENGGGKHGLWESKGPRHYDNWFHGCLGSCIRVNSEDRLRGSVQANDGFKPPGIHYVITGHSLLWPALTRDRFSRVSVIIIINVLRILVYI